MSDDVLSTVLNMLTKEQKEQLVAKLITDVGNLQTEEQKEGVTQPASPPRRVNEDFSVTKSQEQLNKQKRPVKAKANTWTDTGEKKDLDYDPAKYEAMGRKARETSPRDVMIEKRCHVCGKDFKIHSSLVMGSFIRCNNCTG